ncbi:hypothetical protein ACNKHX_20775 [Shigella flexneri]
MGDDEHGWDNDGVFLTSKAAATPRPSSFKEAEPDSTTLSVVMRCWKTSPCVPMALSTLMMVQKPRHPRFLSDLSHR